MPSVLIDFMNNFKLGTGIDIILTLGSVLLGYFAMYKKLVKKIKDEGSEETLEKIEEDKQKQMLEQYKKDISTLQGSLQSVQSELDTFRAGYEREKEGFLNQLKELDTGAESLHDDSVDRITLIKNKILEFDEYIKSMDDKIKDMSEKINMLTDSDISAHRAFIIGEHRRCVQVEKSIDLLALQQVENIYKKYLAEDRTGGDEFIANLIREIRNLPTKPNG